MFEIIFDDGNIYTANTNDGVANIVFNTTGLWMLASHIRGLCKEMSSGDVEEFEDVGLIIKKI